MYYECTKILLQTYRIRPVTRRPKCTGLLFISPPERSDFSALARTRLPRYRVSKTRIRHEKYRYESNPVSCNWSLSVSRVWQIHNMSCSQ